MTVGVLDDRGLLRLFRAVEGRRLLGVLDCEGAIELVFSEDRERPNLVTFYTDGCYRGLVALGGVANAEEYARECRRFEEAA